MKVNEAIEKIKELTNEIKLLEETVSILEERSDRTRLLKSIISEKELERDSLQKRLDATNLAPETLYFRNQTGSGSLLGSGPPEEFQNNKIKE